MANNLGECDIREEKIDTERERGERFWAFSNGNCIELNTLRKS